MKDIKLEGQNCDSNGQKQTEQKDEMIYYRGSNSQSDKKLESQQQGAKNETKTATTTCKRRRAEPAGVKDKKLEGQTCDSKGSETDGAK